VRRLTVKASSLQSGDTQFDEIRESSKTVVGVGIWVVGVGILVVGVGIWVVLVDVWVIEVWPHP